MAAWGRNAPSATTLKTRVKTVTPVERQLHVEVGRERVAASYDAVYRDIQKQAVIPGYRQGKAPRDLLEKHHSDKAKEEVIRRLVADTLDEAIRQEQMRVAGRITVSTVQLDDERGLTFEATVEVVPDFKLGRYKGVALSRKPVTVTDEDIAQVLTRLQEAHAEEVPVEGQDAKERRVPALDDEFAKTVGLATLAELRERVRSDILVQKEAQAKRLLEEALCEELLKRIEFDVPASLIERRGEQLKRDYLMRLMMQGVKEEELAGRLQPVEAQLTANATKLVKLSFLIQRIAEAEHVEITTEETAAQLQRLAARWGATVEQAKAHLERERLWDNFLQELRQEKTIQWLLEQAKIETAAA